MAHHWTVILNPAAASRRGEKHWNKIAGMLRDAGIPYELHRSQHPGHCETLARQAILGGSRHIVAVGGDGTVNEVANGILRQTQVPSPEITLGQIPVGTGNDWGRTMGIPSHYRAAVATLARMHTRIQDAGIVQYQGADGPAERYFVNMAGLGYDAFVGVMANAQKARGRGGKLSYLVSMTRCLMQYKAIPIVYQVDAQEAVQARMFSMVVAVCRFNGGGMMQAPKALPDDGLLDVTAIHEISRWGVIRNTPRLFNGSFVRDPAVHQYRGTEVRIRALEPFLLEVDGENIGQVPATFRMRPAALRVCCR